MIGGLPRLPLVFVVAAAGNYGSASGPSGVLHAPGNDPFVMTVGANDIGSKVRSARHPDWTPDIVKGVLMVAAKPVPQASAGAAGVGQLNAGRAGELRNTPPNDNLALMPLLTSSGSGSMSFDSASWVSVVTANTSWAAASWADASWRPRPGARLPGLTPPGALRPGPTHPGRMLPGRMLPGHRPPGPTRRRKTEQTGTSKATRLRCPPLCS